MDNSKYFTMVRTDVVGYLFRLFVNRYPSDIKYKCKKEKEVARLLGIPHTRLSNYSSIGNHNPRTIVFEPFAKLFTEENMKIWFSPKEDDGLKTHNISSRTIGITEIIKESEPMGLVVEAAKNNFCYNGDVRYSKLESVLLNDIPPRRLIIKYNDFYSQKKLANRLSRAYKGGDKKRRYFMDIGLASMLLWKMGKISEDDCKGLLMDFKYIRRFQKNTGVKNLEISDSADFGDEEVPDPERKKPDDLDKVEIYTDQQDFIDVDRALRYGSVKGTKLG